VRTEGAEGGTAGKIVEEFRDEGVSGALELDHHAGLAALFDRLASTSVRVVVVERADRLARDLMVGEVILSRFNARGVRVVAADSGADLTVGDNDPTRTLIRHVLGAVAQFEKTVLVHKLRAARDRASGQAGRRVEGQKPHGALPG
jgi:DNA invertase Pin-like site-specific DNA recombinase